MNYILIDKFNIIEDRKMPFLIDVINPTKVRDIFHKKLPILTQQYNLSKIEVIRYKPEKRCLIEYSFQGKDTLILIGKIRAKGTDFKSYKLQKKLWQTGFDNDSIDNISVPEVVGIIPEWQMWLQKKVSGEILTSYLTSKKAINICQKVAHIAHKLHQTNIFTDKCHTVSDELNILQQKLPLVIESYPHWQTRIKYLLEKCYLLGEKISDEPLFGIHRDFYFDQIIVSKDRYYLLDLDLYSRGNPCLDIGNFIGHISEYSLRNLGNMYFLKNQENILIKEFIKINKKQYKKQLSSLEMKEFIMINQQNITAYTTLTLVRHIYLSTQFTDRLPYTETLLNLGEERLKKY